MDGRRPEGLDLLPRSLLPGLYGFLESDDLACLRQTASQYEHARAAWPVLDTPAWMDSLTEMALPAFLLQAYTTEVVAYGVRLLARHAKQLTGLHLTVPSSFYGSLSAGDFAAFRCLEDLNIDLRGDGWTGGDVPLPQLRRLTVDGTHALEVLASFAHSPNLQEVKMEAAVTAEVLAVCSSLPQLHKLHIGAWRKREAEFPDLLQRVLQGWIGELYVRATKGALKVAALPLICDSASLAETLARFVTNYCIVLSADASGNKLLHRFDRLSWDGSFGLVAMQRLGGSVRRLRVSQTRAHDMEVLASGVSVVQFWGDPGLVVTISGSPTVRVVEARVGRVEFLDDFRPGTLKRILAPQVSCVPPGMRLVRWQPQVELETIPT